MKIVLLRHGESSANLKGIIDSSEPGASLTKRGIAQIEAIKSRVHGFINSGVIQCYCSPFKRTMQTLDILDIHIPMVLDERIREFDYGQFNQAKTDEISHIIKNYFRDAEHGMIHNKIGVSGESYFSLVSRIYSFMTELLERNEDSLVISHESIFLEIGKLWKVLHPSLAAEEILVKQGELTELVFLSADIALIDRRFDEIKNSRGLDH